MGIFNKIKKKFPKIYNTLKNVNQGILTPIKTAITKKINEIPEEHKDELLMAEEVYKSPNERKREIMGYKYDDELSSKRWAIYVYDGDLKLTIAFRGTVPTNVRDLGSDLKILLQDTLRMSRDVFKKSKYMSEARKVFELTKKKYPNHDITLTGHSLSGRVSIQLANEKNEDAIVFNAGGGDFTRNQLNDKSKHYRSKTDPISVGFITDKRTTNVVNSKPKGINHSISYFK